MSCVCLWIPNWPTGEVWEGERVEGLLEVVPRVALERRGVVWADARGLPAVRVAGELLARLRASGIEGAWAGVSAVPIAAEAAARECGDGGEDEGRGGDRGIRIGADDPPPSRSRSRPRSPGVGQGGGEGVRIVEVGRERDFLAAQPLEVLDPEPRLASLFMGVGITRLGELAALSREAVEVRFGAEAVELWRRARGDDRRRLFAPIPPERPHASLDFVDYVVTDPERLVFTVNALLGGLTEALQSRGEHARRIALTLSLANGREWRRALRPARPTASRETWLRLARAVLERVEVPDAVVGIALEVEAVEAAAVQQGDLFDRGFATASAVEAAIARLIEAQGPVVVEATIGGHPLVERSIEWVPVEGPAAPAGGRPAGAGGLPSAAGGPLRGGRADLRSAGGPPPGGGRAASQREWGRDSGGGASIPKGLTLQLLPEPCPVEVEVAVRRDHEAPVRYRDEAEWRSLITVAGPDRVSGGQWEEAYAREYFRCVTDEGVLVWLFRDARQGGWFLHGWWD